MNNAGKQKAVVALHHGTFYWNTILEVQYFCYALKPLVQLHFEWPLFNYVKWQGVQNANMMIELL